MMGTRLVLLLVWLSAGQNDATPSVGYWEAPANDPHIRRLQSTGTQTQYTVNVHVVKRDAFGPEPARVDVSFVPPGQSEAQRVTVAFPNTDGNAGTKIPMGLQDGASVNISGYEETDAAQATQLKAGMMDQALSLGQNPEQSDKRGVFVASNMEYQRDAGTLAGSRRLNGRRLGNAAAQNTAVIVLYEPCGNSLKAETTKARLQSAFFDTTAGSFNQVLDVCSRSTVSFTGDIVGPVQGCPDSSDVWATYTAVRDQMQGTPEWDNNEFKLMVLPKAWLSAIGVGTVGGSISWYREEYIADPVMFLHEIGHNWKLHHAGGAYSAAEYADTSSAMGYCCSTRCYNFLHSWQLGFADYTEETLSLDTLTSGEAKEVTLKAIGTEFTSGVKILTHSADDTQTGVPAFLVISWRARLGTDKYLEGNSHGNKVQVHHWDGDSRTDAQITFLLHEVNKGTTFVVRDTDKTGQRILTDLKVTVKGSRLELTSDTAEIILCARESGETQDTPTADLKPCEPAQTTPTTTTTTTAVTTVQGTVTVSGVDCSALASSEGVEGLKAGFAMFWSLDVSQVTSVQVPCPRLLSARSLQSADIIVSFELTVEASSGPSSVYARMTGTYQQDLAGNLVQTLESRSVSASSLTVASVDLPDLSTTTTTSGIFRGGTWSSYFNDQVTSEDVAATSAMVGLGCGGSFCSNLRVSHRTDIGLRTGAVTMHQLESDVGDLVCQAGQAAMKVTCVGDSCDSIRLHCAQPQSGSVSTDYVETAWFPSQLDQTEDGMCTGDRIIVGVQCGGAKCATKKLYCAVYTPGDCVPACNTLSLECGGDGCGGSCGTCAAGGEGDPLPVCRGDIGRCIYFVTTEWASSGTTMAKTNLVSTGMGCAGDYCDSVNLIQMSAYSDSASAEKSGWISDNSGKRWFWNSGTQAEDQVADCPSGMAVSFVECDGNHCDNLRFHCAKPLQWVVDMAEEPIVTDWFSEEEQRMDCPEGKVVTGVECQASKKWCLRNCGDYCDNKRLRCRSIRPEMAGAAVLGILASNEMPQSAKGAPPAASPWWDSAGNTISDAWGGIFGSTDSISGAGFLTPTLATFLAAAYAMLH